MEQGHINAVRFNLRYQALKESAARGVVAEQLVFHLVEQHRAAALSDQVLGGNLVKGVQPGFGGCQHLGVGGAQSTRIVSHPGRQTTHRNFGVNIGAGAGDDIQTLFLSHG